MVHMLVEERYTNNNRLSVILNGASSVLKKKHMAIKLHRKIETIPSGTPVVMVVYVSMKWVTQTIEELHAKNIHPLLFGFYDVDALYEYSGITFSYAKTMYTLTKYVLSQNKGKTAFLGYNDDSSPDKQKKTGVEAAVKEFGEELVIFKNHGNVNTCIENFIKDSEGVKNIICGNDGIAVVLRLLYPEWIKDKNICSCSGLKLSENVENPYPTTFVNYYNAGKRLAELYLFLAKNEVVTPTVVSLPMEICVGKEILNVTDSLKPTPDCKGRIIDYYNDESIQEVENLDYMVLNCDEMDIKILKGLMDGQSYEQVAENNYFSVNTVKYRVNLMLKNSRMYKNKKELLIALKKYKLHF